MRSRSRSPTRSGTDCASDSRRLRQLDGRGAGPQQRDRLVVGDPEEPRAQGGVAAAEAERGEGIRQRGLQRVLRVGVVAHDRAAVAVQRLVVALVERGKRAFAPGADQMGQALVAGERRAQACGARARAGARGDVNLHQASIAHAYRILSVRPIADAEANGQRSEGAAGGARVLCGVRRPIARGPGPRSA